MIVGFRDEWLGAFFVIGANGLDARCTGQGDGRAAQTRQRVMQRPHGRDRPDRGSCRGRRCEDSYCLGRLAGEMCAPGLLHRPVSPRKVAPGVAPSPEAHLPDFFFIAVAVNAFCPTHDLQRPHDPQSRLQDRRRCIETGADDSGGCQSEKSRFRGMRWTPVEVFWRRGCLPTSALPQSSPIYGIRRAVVGISIFRLSGPMIV